MNFLQNLSPGTISIIGAGVAVLGAGIAIVAALAARRSRGPATLARTPQFYQLAAHHGWEAYERDDDLFLRRGLAQLFDGETGHYVGPLLRAVVGQNPPHEVIATQTSARGWVNTRGNVSTKVTVTGIRYSAYLVELPAALPTVNFLREGRAGKAATALRLLTDQHTESHQFNEQRRVVAADDRLSHAILTPAVVEAVLSGPAKASLQIVGNYLVSFERGQLTFERAVAGTAWLQRVAAGIPGFVFTDYQQQ